MAGVVNSAFADVWVAARPWQWVKNGVVLLPWAFGLRVGDADATRLVIVTLFGFCALSSGTYLMNDIADRAADRADPLRRSRPIAAGRLAVGTAALYAIAAFLLGLFALSRVAAERGDSVLYLGLGYIALTSAYSFAIKRIEGLGAVTVACGFVLRVFAGGAAAGVVVSHWLTLCTFLGALAVALGKRFADARVSQRDPLARRRLERAARLAAVAFLIAYLAYASSERTRAMFDADGLWASVLPLGWGVFRFFALTKTSTRAIDPARVFLTDPQLVGCVVVYAAICGLVIHRAS